MPRKPSPPSLGEYLLIARPPAGESLVMGFDPGKNLFLDFDPSDSSISRHADGLVFSLENGTSVTITNFFNAANPTPSFVLPDGTRIAPEEFWNKFSPELAAELNSGDIQQQTPADTPEIDANIESLFEGVARLGALGSLYWGNEENEPDKNLMEESSALESLPGGDLVGSAQSYLRAYDNVGLLFSENTGGAPNSASATGNVLTDAAPESAEIPLPAEASPSQAGIDHHSEGLAICVTRFQIRGEWYEANGDVLRWEDADGVEYSFSLSANGEYRFDAIGPGVSSTSISEFDIVYEIRSEDGLTDQASLCLRGPVGLTDSDLFETGAIVLLDDGDTLGMALANASGEEPHIGGAFDGSAIDPASYGEANASAEETNDALLRMMLSGHY